MPVDLSEDLMPRNVPKPAPLIEVAATPLVPEVSLLLEQDRNKSVHFNSSPNINYAEDKSKHLPKEAHIEGLFRNQVESYNSWKAKNAQLLSAITGSSGIPEKTVKNHSTLETCNGVEKPQFNVKEVNYPGTMFTRHVPRTNHASKSELECLDNNVRNCGQHLLQNTDQQHNNNPPSMPLYYPQTDNSHPQTGNGEVMYVLKGPKSQHPKTSQNETNPCFPLNSNGHSPIDEEMQFPNMHCNSQRDSKRHQNVELSPLCQMETRSNTIQGNFNQGHCQCGEMKNGGGAQYLNAQPCASNGGRRRNMPETYSKLLSPLDIAHVNNQAIIDLYHIINLQNEQISMLQQQVKQVLQMHMDCGKSGNQSSNSCVCHKNCCNHETRVSDRDSCSNAHRENDVKSKVDRSPNKKNGSYEISKRSVGVMTRLIEDTEDAIPVKHIEKDSLIKARNKKKRDKKINSPSYNFPNQPVHTYFNNEEGRRRKNAPNTEKRAKPVERTQVDNSFSLNEAELVIRSEQDDVSSNTSVHVDLQDYYSSSVDSDSDATASSSDADQQSESGDDSTDPQLGWTFYNRVLGQVNDILKKTPTPPRQALPPMYRTPTYGLNTDFETENNWSKRVTFDGPSLENSENNSPNFREIPKFDQTMPHQDMRRQDGRGRVQDFMMYNFANGNTNLSFASLRYLDRHHILPSQGKSKPVEQVYQQQAYQQQAYQQQAYQQQAYQQQAYQRSKKHMKKKTRNLDKFSDLPHHMNKRKSFTPSSKLLDITALKQQPKLF